MVVSNIFHVHPYLGKVSNLTHIFQMGGSTTNQRWNEMVIWTFRTELVPRTASKLPKREWPQWPQVLFYIFMKSVHSSNVHSSSKEWLVIIKYTLQKTTMAMKKQHFEDVYKCISYLKWRCSIVVLVFGSVVWISFGYMVAKLLWRMLTISTMKDESLTQL